MSKTNAPRSPEAATSQGYAQPVWYGICGHWTASWSKLAKSTTVPLCPIDAAPGFYAKKTWWQDVDKYEAAGHPGYRKEVEALELP